jgi:hypothetical protein
MEQYKRSLRSAVRGLWSGALDEFDAYEVMQTAIRSGFTRAWNSGAAECGIKPDELSPEETKALNDAILEEYAYIDGFLGAIEKGSRKNKEKLTPLYTRTELWLKRFLDIQNRAKAMACEDQKLAWRLGEAEHCCSCLKLANRVKRASFWREAGVRPQHESLHCMKSAGGPSVCKCRFEVTDEPLSKGPLPNWRC